MHRPPRQQLLGRKFGRLIVVGRVEILHGRSRWYCNCSCGTTNFEVTGNSLVTGNTRSCGCIHIEHIIKLGKQNRKHGRHNTPTYFVWRSLFGRCYIKTNTSWHNYGARNIKVCKRWHKFENFFSDMGEKPAGTTIDRIDNTKGYEPGNCRWVTMKQNQRNRRNNRLISYNGRTQCLSAWAEEFEINESTLASRLDRGWTIERALTKPTRKTRHDISMENS